MHGNDRMMLIAGVIVLVLVMGTALIFGQNEATGTTHTRQPGDYVGGLDIITETISSPSTETGLAQGSTDSITVPQGKLAIKNLTAVLTWVDETTRPGMPRLRRYNNQPDTFTLGVTPPGGNTTQATAANPAGGEGRIEIPISYSNDQINAMVASAVDGGTLLPDWNITVTLDDAGNWSPVLPPRLIGYRDDANAYILEMTIEYYDLSGVLGT